MEPLPVVKDFDPLEAGRARRLVRGKLVAMHQFTLEAAPEAFHLRSCSCALFLAHTITHLLSTQSGQIQYFTKGAVAFTVM